MLSASKPPVQYGYRSVHDLPTPPSTSRPSPPLGYQESRRPLPPVVRPCSPPNQPMSAPHRGLPPPAAMTLVQPPHQSSGPPLPPPPAGSSLGQGPPPLSAQQAQSYAQIPAPPSWQHVSEESMRAYLSAKSEEERRKQEEAKTQQETLRLEQRRVEHDILQTALQGGIPPPMVPVVFAGMGGGTLPQATLDSVQQFIFAQIQHGHPPALLPPGHISTSPHRRDSQAQWYGYEGSGGVPSTPGSARGPSAGYMSGYPASPGRPRGQSIPGGWVSRPPPPGPGANLPNLNTNFAVRGGEGVPTHPGVASVQQQEQQQQQQQSSPPLYIHHWQPPMGQSGGRGGGTDQPGTPSGDSPKKRKATGPQPAPPAPSGGNNPFQGASISHPPPGRRGGGHARHRSDLRGSRAGGRVRADSSFGPSSGPSRPASVHEAPGEAALSSSQQQQQQHQQQQQQQQEQQKHLQSQSHPQTQRSGAHSVSSLLTDNPPSPRSSHYHQPRPSDMAPQHGDRRGSRDEMVLDASVESTKQERGGDVD